MSRKTNHLKLHLPDPNEYYDVELDQNKNFEIIDEVLTPATKSEIESILNQNLIKDVLELATERDVRNLFVGTVLEGGGTYNLSSLSTDESKVVNMRLLSLFNDLLLQKISDKDNVLDRNLRDYINSVKTSLQANINLKEDKTKVAELISSLRTELTNAINKKADKTILINVGAGLTGGGNLSSNVSINLDYATSQEIEELLNKNLLKEVFELATEQDIRNLFTGTKLEGGTEYKLLALSTDESKIVNMRLLSLFNDLILQKLGNDNNSLKSELTSLINSIKATLQNAIDLKANKTTAVTGDGALTGGGDLSANRIINHKTSTGFKHIPSGGAANQFLKYSADGTAIWSAIAWEVITGKKSVLSGTGLKGGGTLENNVTLSLDYGTAEEIKNILK